MKRIKTATLLSTCALVLAVLGASGCASMEEQMRNDACNKDRAYEHGMNDGKANKPMNSGFSTICDLNQRGAITQSYKEGYNAGLANRKALKAGQSTNNSSGNQPLININLGGNSHNAAPKNAFFCETEVFMNRFKAFGSTELEAREAVLSQCTQKNHRMHCENINCQENE